MFKITKMDNDANEFKKKIEQLNLDVQKGNNIIASLKKDIEGLKKEIQERDDTIQDKVLSLINFKINNKLSFFTVFSYFLFIFRLMTFDSFFITKKSYLFERPKILQKYSIKRTF